MSDTMVSLRIVSNEDRFLWLRFRVDSSIHKPNRPIAPFKVLSHIWFSAGAEAGQANPMFTEKLWLHARRVQDVTKTL